MRLRRVPLALTFAVVVHVSIQAQTMFSCAIAETADAPDPLPVVSATKTPEPHISGEIDPEALRLRVPANVSAPAPVPTPLQTISRAAAATYRGAYVDAFRILGEENDCSRFFGGPAAAVEVLNRFVESLQRRTFDERAVAIRMSGNFKYVTNHATGASYRLFDEAAVNDNGPLVRFYSAESLRMAVGSYRAATKSGRALILLHELGHLVRGADGSWLLPNDGGNPALSERNTLKVEGRCRQQLERIRD